MKNSRLSRTALAAASFLSFCLSAHAADSATSVSTGDSSNAVGAPQSTASDKPLLKQFEENSEITDEKMKADAGSLSVISLHANLAYYGPTPGNLSALNQPNPDGVVSATSTAISGSMGMKYRLDSSTTISLYAGVSDDYAFHPQQELDVNSPAISYDKTFRIGGVQVLSSPGVTLITQNAYKRAGEMAGLTYYLAGVYRIGRTGLSIGEETNIGYYFFSRDYQPSDGKVRRISITPSPFLKYNISDNLNINTYVGLSFYNLRIDDSNPFNLNDRLVTQKVGVGWAITRDVYINPYLQFYPSDATLNETTMNIATSFSIL